MGRGFQRRKSDGRCQKGAVEHMQPPGSAGTSNSLCVSGKMCPAYHLKEIRVHFLCSRLPKSISDVWSPNALKKNLLTIAYIIPPDVSLKVEEPEHCA